MVSRIQDSGSRITVPLQKFKLAFRIAHMLHVPYYTSSEYAFGRKSLPKNVVINFLPTYPPQPLAPLDQFLFLLMNWTIVHCPWRIFCHVEKFWDVEIYILDVEKFYMWRNFRCGEISYKEKHNSHYCEICFVAMYAILLQNHFFF